MSTNMNFIKLSKVTTVCFDKERAVCDSSLTIKKLVILDRTNSESEVSQIISNVLNTLDEHSLLLNALREKYDFKQSFEVKSVLSYSFDTDSFGATFKGNKTYIIGPAENIPLKNKAGVLRRCEEYISQGQDVYVLGYGLGEIVKESFNGELDALALIVVKENIRKSIPSSIKWLNDNNINVKVISSDSALKTASIAYEAGVLKTDQQVSLESTSLEKAYESTIIGDASKEDKKKFVKGLNNKGEKVLYIDDECDDLIKTFENSKRLTNNLYKVGLLLISKLLLGLFLIPLLLVNAKDNPFDLYRYFIFDSVINAVSVVLLLVDKTTNEVNGKFVTNVLKKSLPGAILMFASVLIYYVLYSKQSNSEINLGFYNIQITNAVSMISFAVLGLVVLYNVLTPLSKYYRKIMIISGGVTAILLAVSMIISYTTNRSDPLFNMSFNEMNGPTYLVMGVTIIILMGLYVMINRIIDAFKGKDA